MSLHEKISEVLAQHVSQGRLSQEMAEVLVRDLLRVMDQVFIEYINLGDDGRPQYQVVIISDDGAREIITPGGQYMNRDAALMCADRVAKERGIARAKSLDVL